MVILRLEDILDANLLSIMSALLPTSSIPAATDDNLYDIMVPKSIGNTASTPYFDLARGITMPVAREFSTDSSDSNTSPETEDGQHVEEL